MARFSRDNSKLLDKFGGMKYWISSLICILRRKTNINISIQTQTTLRTIENVFLGVVANGKYFGCGMFVSPDSNLSDHLFNLVIIHHATIIYVIFQLMGDFLTGNHIKRKETCLNEKWTELVVSADHELDIEIDGDVIGTTPAHFEMIPSAIKCL